jgi:hypothetical protein
MAVVGPQGVAGAGGGAPTDLPLAVTVNYQTQFSIFTIPAQSALIINNAEYHQNTHYTLSMVALNATLTWLNIGFALQIGDEIIFRKF